MQIHILVFFFLNLHTAIQIKTVFGKFYCAQHTCGVDQKWIKLAMFAYS